MHRPEVFLDESVSRSEPKPGEAVWIDRRRCIGRYKVYDHLDLHQVWLELRPYETLLRRESGTLSLSLR
jgi:hypothetical protein